MADQQGVVVKNIARRMAVGLAVYDEAGNKVGTVAQYDTNAGWMKVNHRVFAPTDLDLYLPFRTIKSIDPREIYLSLAKDVLERDYSSLVPRTPLVERAMGQITVGMQASTVLGEDLGTITNYDPAAGDIRVENERTAERSLSIPVTLVDSVSSEARKVFIALTKDALLQLALMNPSGVLFVEAPSSETR
jgi:hypothetical protein